MKGVLGSFGRAILLRCNDNSYLLFQEDLRQFGKLMETVVGYHKTGVTDQQTEVNIVFVILSFSLCISFFITVELGISPPHGPMAVVLNEVPLYITEKITSL